MAGMTQACMVVVTRVADRNRCGFAAVPAGFGTGVPAQPVALG